MKRLRLAEVKVGLKKELHAERQNSGVQGFFFLQFLEFVRGYGPMDANIGSDWIVFGTA